MDLVSSLLLGFSTAITIENIILCFAGVLIGTFVGVLPGLGNLATLSILLPLTFHLSSPTSAIIFLAGIYYGSQYGGSITSILMNLPGEPSTVITTIDGYQMTKKGRGGAALSISAIGSFIAGTIATFLILALGIAASDIAVILGPVEFTSLMALGILISVLISKQGILKNLGMCCIGILLGLIGIDTNSGSVRFTFELIDLYQGIHFGIVAMGVFGAGEMLYNVVHDKSTYPKVPTPKDLYPTKSEYRDAMPAIFRGTVIGSFLGLIPGIGPLMASFISYYIEKFRNKNPNKFGHGAIEGVASPESANNAASQTNFIPTLMLGIPSTPAMAIILVTLMIHGIAVGPAIISSNPDMFWGLIVSMWIGNLFLLILNLPLIGLWIKLLRIKIVFLYPMIILICLYGAYSLGYGIFGIYLFVLFAVFGYIFKFLDCDPIPLAMGFIIGKLFEEYYRRSLLLSNGDLSIFIDKPISLSVIIIILLLILGKILFHYSSKSRISEITEKIS
jgi:putative tricarboxylic transport membrane protein